MKQKTIPAPSPVWQLLKQLLLSQVNWVILALIAFYSILFAQGPDAWNSLFGHTLSLWYPQCYFADLRYFVLAMENYAAGKDYLSGVNDTFQYPYIFPLAPLYLGKLGVKVSWLAFSGGVFLGAFVVWLRVVFASITGARLIAVFLFVASPAIALLVERMNVDLPIMLSMTAAVILGGLFARNGNSPPTWTLLLFVLACIGGFFFKLYPLQGLLLIPLIERSTRRLAAWTGGSLVAMALIVLREWENWPRVLGNLGKPDIWSVGMRLFTVEFEKVTSHGSAVLLTVASAIAIAVPIVLIFRRAVPAPIVINRPVDSLFLLGTIV